MIKIAKYIENLLIKIYNLICHNLYYNQWGCKKNRMQKKKAKKNNDCFWSNWFYFKC